MKKLKLMYFVFLSTQVMFVLTVLFIRSGAYFSLQDEGNVYLYIAPFFAVAGFLGGKTVYQNQVVGIAGKATLKEKFDVYTSAFLVRMALMEAPVIFAAIAFLITGNLACLAIAGLMILYFLTLRPSNSQIVEDMELNSQEKEEWNEVIRFASPPSPNN